MVSRIKELIEYRELLKCLIVRDIILRYKGSVMGFFWALLNPLMMMIIFMFVFTKIMRMDIPHYPLFLFSAFIPWSFFLQSVTSATISISMYSSVISKAYFPREVIPLSMVMSSFVHTFLVGFAVNLILVLIYRLTPGASIVMLPLVFVVQILFTAGMCFFFSCLQVYFKDITVLLNHILTFWLYATPIIYPLSMVPEPYYTWIRFNPLTGIILSYRNIIFEGKGLPLEDFLYSAIVSIVVFAGGYYFFNRYSVYFAEEI